MYLFIFIVILEFKWLKHNIIVLKQHCNFTTNWNDEIKFYYFISFQDNISYEFSFPFEHNCRFFLFLFSLWYFEDSLCETLHDMLTFPWLILYYLIQVRVGGSGASSASSNHESDDEETFNVTGINPKFNMHAF